MRGGKKYSQSKKEAKSRGGVLDNSKGAAAQDPKSHPSSDSDDDNVMRQLLSSGSQHRATTAGGVAIGRSDDSDGPASDVTDDPGSAMSQDDDGEHAGILRGGPRSIRTDSPATTPAGTPSQTPGPTTSSSEGALRHLDNMDVDMNGDEAPLRDTGKRRASFNARSNGATSPEPAIPEARPLSISYVACHTWPPCAVCARISGVPKNVTASLRRQKPTTLVLRPINNTQSSSNTAQPVLAPQPADQVSAQNSARSSNAPRNGNEQRAVHVPRLQSDSNMFIASSYPMEPLFVSAGVTAARQGSFRNVPPPASTRGMPPPTSALTARQAVLASASAPVRHGPYSRAPTQRNAQASSSAVRVEDMDDDEPRSPTKTRGRGKLRAAREAGRKQRAKRYNRKKREEWPPEGWNPIWEEERPRIWRDYEIPDEVPTEKVYDHLKRRFELKSAGVCHWKGCIPQDPSAEEYKMLKRHVETVHLGLKLVCKLCGVRKRADNRRKATHKRGCPEREDGPAAPHQAKATGKAKEKAASGADVPEEEDELVEDADEGGDEDEDEDEDDEVDQLDEEQYGEGSVEEGQGDEQQDQPMESEYESEDD